MEPKPQPTLSFADQSTYDVRLEWGVTGLQTVGRGCNAVVIIDVFSFTTSVSIALENGALVTARADDDDEVSPLGHIVARTREAKRPGDAYTLSPASLATLPAGTRLILSSRNGGRCCAEARRLGIPAVFAAALRNVSAVAAALERIAPPIAIIPCGERWPNGDLRPALEDWVCAGLIASASDSLRLSPEARAAGSSVGLPIADLLRECASARELCDAGYAEDVELALARDVTRIVPSMDADGYFRPIVPTS